MSNPDSSRLVTKAREAMNAGKVGGARNWLVLGFTLSQSFVIQEVRRSGVLRASKYAYRSKSLMRLVDELIGVSHKIELLGSTKEYLTSVRSLLSVAEETKTLHSWIVRALKERESGAIKTLVAIVDLVFLKGKSSDRFASSDDPIHYSQEDLAEALSLLIYLFDENVGIADRHLGLIDRRGLAQGIYDRMLMAACKIRVYNEAEILLDAFDYAVSASPSRVHVEARDSRLEKSIRLGYIQTDLQLTADTYRGLTEDFRDVLSFREVAEHMYARLGSTLVQHVKVPVPRYIVVFPGDPAVFEPFRDDRLFQEDCVYLKRASKDNYIPIGDLINSQLVESLKVIDIVRVQRMVHFFRLMMAQALEPLMDVDRNTVLESIVPVFEASKFTEFVSSCVADDAALALIEMLKYEHRRAEVMDVQYRPVIAATKYLLVPFNILGTSNLLRNLLYTQRRKLHVDASQDPMPHTLVAAFKKAGFLAAGHVKVKVQDRTLEIDVLALLDDVLLVLECKSAFHPCGPHELRTSFDHVRRAATQLSRLRDALSDDERREQLLRGLGWGIAAASEVRTCVVTGNRLFNGYVMQGHPVCQAYEFVNLLISGVTMYSRVKQAAMQTLSLSEPSSEASRLAELSRHVGEIAIPIDDREFLRLKQRHHLKVEISRYLDSHPGASILLLRVRIWCRDNLRQKRGS